MEVKTNPITYSVVIDIDKIFVMAENNHLRKYQCFFSFEAGSDQTEKPIVNKESTS